MLGLGRILISDLVVANLLMYSLPVMILHYLAEPFLHQRCFWMTLLYTCDIIATVYRETLTKGKFDEFDESSPNRQTKQFNI